jgi:uncharacterized repeat protein (TIGR01451 family)
MRTFKVARMILLTIVVLSATVSTEISCFEAFALAGPWGPERQTYTWEEPAKHAVFNSITNNPGLGDERNFVRIREAGAAKYADEVRLEAGKEYEVYSYYHNNATDKSLREGEKPIGQTETGIADEVRMHANFPAKVRAGERLAVNTIISARFSDSVDASVPREIWDGAYVSADDTVYLRYVPGTATIHNAGELNGKNVGPDYLFSEQGALLGYNIFSGILPGCNEYAGYVTYRFRVDQPRFEMSKQVAHDGKDEWMERIVAVPNEILDFRIVYKNTGTTEQSDVTIRDALDDGSIYPDGAVSLIINGAFQGTVSDDLFGVGLNIGKYQPGSQAELRYKAKVADEGKFNGDDTVLTNTAGVVTADGVKEDSVEVTVKKTGIVPVPKTSASMDNPLTAFVIGVAVMLAGTFIIFGIKHLREKRFK